MHLSLHKPRTKALSITEATPFKNLYANTFDPLGSGCKLKDAHISFTCALYEVCRSIQEKSTNFKGIKLIVFVLSWVLLSTNNRLQLFFSTENSCY